MTLKVIPVIPVIPVSSGSLGQNGLRHLDLAVISSKETFTDNFV